MRITALLILLPLLLPVASAQLPEAPASCGPLDATVTPPASMPPNGQAEVTVSVTNNGDNPNDVRVTVAASTTTAGWQLLDAEDRTVRIPAGESGAVTFVVVTSSSASEDGVLNFAISGTCALPGNVACPNASCDAAALARTTVIPVQRAEGFQIPGLSNVSFPLEYLVAGIALVAIATALPFLVKRKPGGFRAGCPEPLKMVKPGRGTSFPLEIHNPTQEPLTAQFDLAPVPEGWSAFLPLPEVQLAAKETRTLWLMVRAPAASVQGDAADVEVRLRNAARPEATQAVRMRAEVHPEAAEPAPVA